MTDGEWPDAARDALALVALYLETAPGQLPEQAACEAILQNGDPAKTALMAAMVFARCLTLLERGGAIDSAAGMLRNAQQTYLSGSADT